MLFVKTAIVVITATLTSRSCALYSTQCTCCNNHFREIFLSMTNTEYSLLVAGIFFTKVQTPCQRHRVCLFVSSKLKTLRYGFLYSELCSVIGLKHMQDLLICNKSDTKSKTNCSYVRIFSSKFHQFIGPIDTGGGSSVWDELWERTVARRIIRLDELSTMVRLTRQTIAIALVDG